MGCVPNLFTPACHVCCNLMLWSLINLLSPPNEQRVPERGSPTRTTIFAYVMGVHLKPAGRSLSSFRLNCTRSSPPQASGWTQFWTPPLTITPNSRSISYFLVSTLCKIENLTQEAILMCYAITPATPNSTRRILMDGWFSWKFSLISGRSKYFVTLNPLGLTIYILLLFFLSHRQYSDLGFTWIR